MLGYFPVYANSNINSYNLHYWFLMKGANDKKNVIVYENDSTMELDEDDNAFKCRQIIKDLMRNKEFMNEKNDFGVYVSWIKGCIECLLFPEEDDKKSSSKK